MSGTDKSVDISNTHFHCSGTKLFEILVFSDKKFECAVPGFFPLWFSFLVRKGFCCVGPELGPTDGFVY